MSSDRQLVLETIRKALSSDSNFQSQWEMIVEKLISSDGTNDPQLIAESIRKSGVLEHVVQKLRQNERGSPQLSKGVIVDKTHESNFKISDNIIMPTTAHDDLAELSALDSLPVQFQLKKGINFVDYMSLDSTPVPERPAFQIVFCYNGVRSTTNLYLAAPEVVFSSETHFAFNVPLPATKNSATLRSFIEYLLNAKQHVYVYLLEYKQTNDSWIPTLKMQGSVEWRHCLHSQSLRVELKGVGETAQQVLGLLEIEANIGLNLHGYVAGDVVELHLTVEASKRTEGDRAFINYARLWHKDFVEMNPILLARRAVKLFVRDERGCVRFPSSLIAPDFAPGRLIETPQQCARFVSLLGSACRDLQTAQINEDVDTWFTTEASLTSGTTTSGGRAVLLCSFLLGLGLDAFVCLGRAAATDGFEEEEVVRIWVMTCTSAGPDSAEFERVVFWDPASGSTHLIRPKSSPTLQQCPFRTLDCVFRHDLFLGNSQSSNKLLDVSFDFSDNEKWRALDVTTCPQVEACLPVVQLQPWSNRRFGTNFCAMADWLEEEFMRLFAEHRRNIDLVRAEWDQKLSASLGMALTSYEMASNFGSNFVIPKDFFAATRNLVPYGCILRAVPMQLPMESVASPTRSFTSALTRCQAARDVVELPGHVVRAALRVKIIPYAERVASVWVMLAAFSKPN